MEYILEKKGDVAAVIAEPIRSTPTIPKPEYWQTIRRACNRHRTLLIFDEIPHSLGRTGRMFTFENFGVVPDMVFMYATLSRGLSFKTTMGNILTLTPPLIITRPEMDQALAIIEESIAEIEKQR